MCSAICLCAGAHPLKVVAFQNDVTSVHLVAGLYSRVTEHVDHMFWVSGFINSFTVLIILHSSVHTLFFFFLIFMDPCTFCVVTFILFLTDDTHTDTHTYLIFQLLTSFYLLCNIFTDYMIFLLSCFFCYAFITGFPVFITCFYQALPLCPTHPCPVLFV